MRESLLLLATAMLIIMALGCKELSVTKDAGSVITTRTPTANTYTRADSNADANADANANSHGHLGHENGADADLPTADPDADSNPRAQHLPAESSHPECSYKQAANT